MDTVIKLYDFGVAQPSSEELKQFYKYVYSVTNGLNTRLKEIEAAPESFFTRVIWQAGQTNLGYGVKWQRLQQFSYNRITYFGTLGGSELYLIQLFSETYYVRKLKNSDLQMVELSTVFDVTKTYNDHAPLADSDKQKLQGADKFMNIENILIRYVNRHGANQTTIIKDIQPNGRNAAYCYFHLVSDNDNNEYMIIIDVNNKWYYVKKLTA